ncbi:hypothetical protein ACP26L_12505 [Paenibacillus sp. S-38]|uniref:hypothetical protein n=1 Tax=Paenibacillus sp. S-38 TaxID=3416710 RepID=UPI003CF62CE3
MTLLTRPLNPMNPGGLMSLLQPARPYLITLLVLAYAMHVLTGWAWAAALQGWLAVLCYLVSFPAARRLFQVVGSLFIAASLACMAWAGVPWSELPGLMTRNVMLVALLFMLPFVNRAIRLGGYDRNLSRWLNAPSGGLGQLYIRSLAVSYILSLFLFFAALPLLHRVLGRQLRNAGEDTSRRFIGMSVLRGFGMVAVWSPVEPLVATAVLLTGVSYLALLPWLLAVSLVLFAACCLWALKFRSLPLAPAQEADPSQPPAQPKAHSIPKTLVFLGALVLLIGSAFLLQAALGSTFFAAMTFVLLPFAAGWALLLKRFGRFAALSSRHWKEGVDNLRHLLVLFLSFGLFNSVLARTPLLGELSGSVESLSGSPLLVFLIILAVSLVLPVLGIHPLVVMSLFGIFLQPVMEHVSPLSLAVVMITSTLASSFMGTFNTTVTIMAGLLEVNPYRITQWNLAYGIVFGGIGIAAGLLLL